METAKSKETVKEWRNMSKGELRKLKATNMYIDLVKERSETKVASILVHSFSFQGRSGTNHII